MRADTVSGYLSGTVRGQGGGHRGGCNPLSAVRLSAVQRKSCPEKTMTVKILPPLYSKNKAQQRQSKKGTESAKFYGSQRWRLTSVRHRQMEPLCRQCKSEGRVTAGTLTDHIVPINRG